MQLLLMGGAILAVALAYETYATMTAVDVTQADRIGKAEDAPKVTIGDPTPTTADAAYKDPGMAVEHEDIKDEDQIFYPRRRIDKFNGKYYFQQGLYCNGGQCAFAHTEKEMNALDKKWGGLTEAQWVATKEQVASFHYSLPGRYCPMDNHGVPLQNACRDVKSKTEYDALRGMFPTAAYVTRV